MVPSRFLGRLLRRRKAQREAEARSQRLTANPDVAEALEAADINSEQADYLTNANLPDDTKARLLLEAMGQSADETRATRQTRRIGLHRRRNPNTRIHRTIDAVQGPDQRLVPTSQPRTPGSGVRRRVRHANTETGPGHPRQHMPVAALQHRSHTLRSPPPTPPRTRRNHQPRQPRAAMPTPPRPLARQERTAGHGRHTGPVATPRRPRHRHQRMDQTTTTATKTRRQTTKPNHTSRLAVGSGDLQVTDFAQ